jgi:hypothetical protein
MEGKKVAHVYAKNVLKTAIFLFGKNPRSDRPRLYPAASRLRFPGSVADPHHIDANADPDPSCHFYADPDPDPSFQIKDPDPQHCFLD